MLDHRLEVALWQSSDNLLLLLLQRSIQLPILLYHDKFCLLLLNRDWVRKIKYQRIEC